MTPPQHSPLRSCARAVAAISTLTALLGTAEVHAQSDPVHTRVVIGAGISFAGAGPETSAGIGLGGHIGMRHQRGDYVFALRAGMNGGGVAPISVPGGGSLRDRFDELAFLVGRGIYRTPVSQVVLSAGLAAVEGERVVRQADGGARTVGFGTEVGLPIQLAISNPGPTTGFGLAVHVNLNAEEIFGAVTATYLIGLDR